MFGLIASRTSKCFKDLQSKTLDSVMEPRNLEQDSKPSLLSTNIQVSLRCHHFLLFFGGLKVEFTEAFYIFGYFESVSAKQLRFHVRDRLSLMSSVSLRLALQQPTSQLRPQVASFQTEFCVFSFKLLFASHFSCGLCLAWSSKQQRPQL